MSQRALQQVARRLSPSGLLLRTTIPPAAFFTQTRTTTSVPAGASATSVQDATQILVNQRLHRPVAPHLGIYRPQITWYASALNRITGITLSGSLYVFGLGYLIASVSGGAIPLLGWTMSSAAMAAGFAKWPVVLKVSAKLLAALPFTFHSFNGVRHLLWDLGLQLTNPQVMRTGWTVVGLTVVSSLGLALFT